MENSNEVILIEEDEHLISFIKSLCNNFTGKALTISDLRKEGLSNQFCKDIKELESCDEVNSKYKAVGIFLKTLSESDYKKYFNVALINYIDALVASFSDGLKTSLAVSEEIKF